MNEAKQKLIDLIKQQDLEIYDEETRWFFFNRLWYSPTAREAFYGYFLSFLRPLIKKARTSDTVLLVPEGLSSSFGIMPFAFQVAIDLKLPIAIWKEFANELTATPYLFPDRRFLPSKPDFIVLNDVVANGSILRKLGSYFYENELDAGISIFATILQVKAKSQQLSTNLEFLGQQQANRSPLFKSMITTEELGETKYKHASSL